MRSKEFINTKKLSEAELYDVRWRKTIVQGQTVWEVLLSNGTVEIRPWNFGQQQPPNLKPMPGFPNGNPDWEYGRRPTTPSAPPGSIPIPEPSRVPPAHQTAPTTTPSGPPGSIAIPEPPRVPPTGQTAPTTTVPTAPTQPAVPNVSRQPGSAGARAIMAANPNRIKDVNKIRAGDVITIPGKGQYKIAPGDTLNAIAAGRGRGQMLTVRK